MASQQPHAGSKFQQLGVWYKQFFQLHSFSER